MSDLIDRQAAIDAIQAAYIYTDGGEDKNAVWTNVGLTNALHIMQDLPSAQPEIVRCEDCKNWDTTWQNDWAKNYHYCPLIDGTRNGDWYCADAERREE